MNGRSQNYFLTWRKLLEEIKREEERREKAANTLIFIYIYSHTQYVLWAKFSPVCTLSQLFTCECFFLSGRIFVLCLFSHLNFMSFTWKLISHHHLRRTSVAKGKYSLRTRKWKGEAGVIGTHRAIGFYKGIGSAEGLSAGANLANCSCSKSLDQPFSPISSGFNSADVLTGEMCHHK